MAITAGRNATAAETLGAAYETAFSAPTNGVGANLIQIKCLTYGCICKINDTSEFLVQAGETEYRRAASPYGIATVELKNSTGDNATVVWDVDVIAGA